MYSNVHLVIAQNDRNCWYEWAALHVKFSLASHGSKWWARMPSQWWHHMNFMGFQRTGNLTISLTVFSDKVTQLNIEVLYYSTSYPGHYVVDPYTWPWSPNGHGHEWLTPIVQCQLSLPFWDTAISKLHHGNPCQHHAYDQRSRSQLTLKIQRLRSLPRSNSMVTFEAQSSIDMFAFCFMAIGTFLAEI